MPSTWSQRRTELREHAVGVLPEVDRVNRERAVERLGRQLQVDAVNRMERDAAGRDAGAVLLRGDVQNRVRNVEPDHASRARAMRRFAQRCTRSAADLDDVVRSLELEQVQGHSVHHAVFE